MSVRLERGSQSMSQVPQHVPITETLYKYGHTKSLPQPEIERDYIYRGSLFALFAKFTQVKREAGFKVNKSVLGGLWRPCRSPPSFYELGRSKPKRENNFSKVTQLS